ncbi:MAG: hypothetical protein FD149_2379 [Rhodospirillaceae bacterium]|nr:MAG: hypothetical protein FD149_2379 [Rhodospirillaceae bacterium]
MHTIPCRFADDRGHAIAAVRRKADAPRTAGDRGEALEDRGSKGVIMEPDS